MVYENRERVRKLLDRVLSDLNQVSNILLEENKDSIPMDLTAQLANVKRAHKELRLHWIALLAEQGVGLNLIKPTIDAVNEESAKIAIKKGNKIREKLRGS